MSSLMNEARSRVPRFAEAAVERARLTVVPRTANRAARVPFVALVSLILVAGVAGLLFFNTSMQQVSFTVTAMEHRAEVLDARQQGLQMDLDRLRNPQLVATRAKKLGMVPPASPAFIRLSDGTVLGDPVPASSLDAIRINPLPTRRPKNLRPTPIKAFLDTPVTASTTGDAASRRAAAAAKAADAAVAKHATSATNGAAGGAAPRTAH